MTATKVGTLPFAPGPVYYAKKAVIDILCLGAFHEAGYGINFPNSRELTLTASDGKALTFVRGKNYLYYLSALEHDPTLAIMATLPGPMHLPSANLRRRLRCQPCPTRTRSSRCQP
jgi:hypothetical protein